MKRMLVLPIIAALCLPALAWSAEKFTVKFNAKFVDKNDKAADGLKVILTNPTRKILKARAQDTIKDGKAVFNLDFDKWQSIGIPLKLRAETPAGEDISFITQSGEKKLFIEFKSFHYQPRSTKPEQFLSSGGSIKVASQYARSFKLDWSGKLELTKAPVAKKPVLKPGLVKKTPAIPDLKEVKVLTGLPSLVKDKGNYKGLNYKFLFKDSKGKRIVHEQPFAYDLQICTQKPRQIKTECDKVLWEVKGANGKGNKFKQSVLYKDFQAKANPKNDKQLGFLKAVVHSGGKKYESKFGLGVYVFNARLNDGSLVGLKEVKISGVATDSDRDKKKDAYKFNVTFWNDAGGIMSFEKVPFTVSYKLFTKKKDGSKGKLLKRKAGIRFDTSSSMKSNEVIKWAKLRINRSKMDQRGIIEIEVKAKVRGKSKTFTASNNRAKLWD